MMRNKTVKGWRWLLAAVLFLGIGLLLYGRISEVLRRKSGAEADMIHTFYDVKKDSLDVLLLGSSHLYYGVQPNVLWREYGIAAYDMGSAEQTVASSYFLLKEALAYQKPEVVVLETYYLWYPELYNGEARLRQAFDGMRYGKAKREMLDVMLPDESGYDIVRKLRKRPATQDIPIIMVTAKTTEMDMIKGLDGGADDYIKKPFSIMELITRVKALLRRTAKEEPKLLKLDDLVIDHERHVVTVNNEPVDLTYKEYELLRLLMGSQGIVMTREVIMRSVWDTDFEGETRTVDMHIKTLRHKLGDYGSRIKTVRNVGYVIE